MKTILKILLIGALLLCTQAIAYGVTYEYYPDTGYLKRVIQDNGDIYEYLNELSSGHTAGRMSLIYNAATQLYKTYDWASATVLVTEYAGIYSVEIGDPLGNDVVLSELRYDYTYKHFGRQWDLDPATNGWRLLMKNEYYEHNPWVLICRYTYYDDSTNRMEWQIRINGDPHCYTRTHYINENWNGQGYGRVDALDDWHYWDPNAIEKSWTYTYYNDANGRLRIKKAYSDNTWTTLYGTYIYYNDVANLRETFTLVAVDGTGNIYYHYINENWNNQGCGRVDKSKRQTAINGELSHVYTYYSDATGRLYRKTAYATASFTTPVARYTYANDTTGLCIKKEVYSGSAITVTYTYYNNATNRMSSKTLAAPDPAGNSYYYYKDEDWNSQGCGRVYKSKRQTAINGELSHVYTYYSDATGRLYQKTGYATVSFTTPVARYTYANDATGLRIKKEAYSAGVITDIYTYYNDSTNRLSSKTFIDIKGYHYYTHYKNENWNNQGYGRIDKAYNDSPAGGPEHSWTYTYYSDANGRLYQKMAYATANFTTLVARYTYANDTTGLCIKKEAYSAGVITDIYTYYNDSTNRLESKTFIDIKGYHYYTHYKNENWNNQGYGRIDKAYNDSPAGGPEHSWTYTYYNDAYGRLYMKKAYSNSKWTTLYGTYIYYNDVTNLQETLTLVAADGSGNIYYHYINENWNKQGCGRVDKSKRATADSDCCLSHTYSYYNDQYGRLYMKTGYADNNWTGAQISVYTYYNDSTNRMESRRQIAGGPQYYSYTHYMNENWNNQGCGRVDKSSDNCVWRPGPHSWTYAYYNSIPGGRLSLKTAYSDTNWTTFAASYHYLDENFNNRDYGRVDMVRNAAADPGDGTTVARHAFLDSTTIDKVLKKVTYMNESDPLTSWVRIYNYYASADWRLEAMTLFESGVQTTYTHIDDAGNMTDAKLTDRSDGYGNVFYKYMDNTGWKPSYQILASADGDGALSYMYDYYSNGTTTHYKYLYSDKAWGDDEAVNGAHFLCTYIYDTNGNFMAKTTSFVNAGTGDVNEVDQRLAIQAKVKTYNTTAQGGYKFVSSMSSQTYDPNNLPNQ